MFRPRRAIPQAIYDRLDKEQARRKDNPNWIEDEILALWEETNRQRAMLGKGPIALEKVKDAESMAMGHIDYTAKCAYYCAELVEGNP